MIRRAFAALGLLLMLPVQAEVTEGREYQLLSPPQASSATEKIEVLEFFSYACPHCYEFHPSLNKWATQLPSNAVLVRVPVAFGRREWGPLVRTYYALEATGDLARLDNALFEAIHAQRQPLFDEASITAWVAAQGVNAEKFRSELNSQKVSTKSLQAEQMARNYRVSGVPHLAVDGKYSVIGKTFEEMLSIARQLIDKAQAQKQAANR